MTPLPHQTASSTAPSPRTTVRRKPARARYDAAALHAVLDAALICHIAFVEAGCVHSLPMLGWRVGAHFYVHAARKGRLAAALEAGECALSVARVDGLVLARSAYRHSLNYRSAVIYGRFVAVDDPAAQQAAYAALVDHLVPGRSAAVRAPSAGELGATRLLRLPLAEAAVKCRTGGVDEIPGDLAWPAWAGVVPLVLGAGEPLPAADCGPYPAPGRPGFLAIPEASEGMGDDGP